jgi:hypothetical protein
VDRAARRAAARRRSGLLFSLQPGAALSPAAVWRIGRRAFTR